MDRRQRWKQTHNEISISLPSRSQGQSRDSIRGLRRQRPTPGHWSQSSPPRTLHQLKNNREIRKQRRRTNNLQRTSPRSQRSRRSKVERQMRRPPHGREIEDFHLSIHGSQRSRRHNNTRSNSRKNQRGSTVLPNVPRTNRDTGFEHDQTSHRPLLRTRRNRARTPHRPRLLQQTTDREIPAIRKICRHTLRNKTRNNRTRRPIRDKINP